MLGGAVHQCQPLGDQTGLEHAVARFLHQLRDVDAHRADRGAATAHRARVVQQLLPVLQIGNAGLFDQSQCAHDGRKRAGLAPIGAAQQFQLADGRVLGVSGGHVEMAGFGAQAAMYAGFEVHGRGAAKLAHEAAHRRVDPFLVALRALPVEGRRGGGSGHWVTSVLRTAVLLALGTARRLTHPPRDG